MNKDTSKLGRGLSSLFSTSEAAKSNEKTIKLINISSIDANLQQPRKKFGKISI